MATKNKINLLDKFNHTMENINTTAKNIESVANSIGITQENMAKAASAVNKAATTTGKITGDAIVNGSKFVGEKSVEVYNAVSTKIKETDWSQYEIEPEVIIKQVLKIPSIKVDRELFLKKELIKYYPDNVVKAALDKNPAYAGIEREKINEIADQVISYETNKVSAISFAAGMPGGLTMVASVPADIAQYFGHVAVAMQKLIYLYGFEELNFDETDISDDTLNQLMIFLGVMFGVQAANAGVKTIAEVASAKVAKSLASKALTKTTVYPIVKNVVTKLGFNMTKAIFANGVSKVVPIVGGLVSGGLTYATFKPSCIRLKNSFMDLRLSDPATYKDIIEIEKI